MPIEDVINSLQIIRNNIKGSTSNPSALASLAVEASTVNSYLGDYLGTTKKRYELERAKAFNRAYEEKPSIASAEAIARAETAELKGQIAIIEILHKDIERIVSSIQTKVRTLEGQAKNQI